MWWLLEFPTPFWAMRLKTAREVGGYLGFEPCIMRCGAKCGELNCWGGEEKFDNELRYVFGVMVRMG